MALLYPPWYDPNTERIVRRFATGPETDDIILLRPGTSSSIHAVGIIVEGGCQGYDLLDAFNNIYGWELGHTRRVVWKPCQHDFGQRVFFPVRFSAIQNAQVVQFAQLMYSEAADRLAKPSLAPSASSTSR